MVFITCAKAALAVALSASSGAAPVARSTGDSTPPQPLALIMLSSSPPDSACAANKLAGTVTDSAKKGLGGLFIQDGVAQPIGQRVKTDDAGAFNITLDKSHSIIWVFADSTSAEKGNPSIGQYDKSKLQIKDCTAAPITIIVNK